MLSIFISIWLISNNNHVKYFLTLILQHEGQSHQWLVSFWIVFVKTPSFLIQIKNSNANGLQKFFLSGGISKNAVFFCACVAKHIYDVLLVFRRFKCLERLHSFDGWINNESGDFWNFKPQVPITVHDMFTRTGSQNIQLRFLIVWLDGWAHFGVVKHAIAFLSENFSNLFCDKKNLTLKTHFKNVMLIEQPSAAPTPVSLRICWACMKFSADNKALVIKWRAENIEKKVRICFTDTKSLNFVTSFAAVKFVCAQSVDGEDQTMMIVVHGVAWKMTSIAKWCKTFFGHFISSLGWFGNDVSWDKVVIVEIFW